MLTTGKQTKANFGSALDQARSPHAPPAISLPHLPPSPHAPPAISSSPAQEKHPTTLIKLNHQIYAIFILVAFMCTLGATCTAILVHQNDGAWYLEGPEGPPLSQTDSFGVSWSRYLLLVYMLVPTNLFAIMPQARSRDLP